MQLRDVNFGKDTADFDANLREYFLRTAVYERILRGESSIVVGRKGSGKTAHSWW